MDFLSSVFTWLSDHEAGISAVMGIAVLAGIIFTGIRFLLSRRSHPPRVKHRRMSEARSALEELLRLYPGFTAQKLNEALGRYSFSDDRIRLWAAALRKAGLPE